MFCTLDGFSAMLTVAQVYVVVVVVVVMLLMNKLFVLVRRLGESESLGTFADGF